MYAPRALFTMISAFLFAATAVLAAQSGVPEVPTNLTASATGSTVAIVWEAGSGPAPTGYVLEAALSAGGPAIAVVPVTTPGLTAPAVPDGTYYLRVRATNAAGTGPASAEVVVTVGAPACAAAPAAPAGLSHSVAGGVVAFTWSAGAGGCAPTHYVLSAGSGPGLSNIATVNVGLATSLAAPAPPGTYVVRVAAANAWGTSAASNEVTFTLGPSCTVPGAPEGFVSAGAGSLASFQWQPPLSGDAPTGYLLEAGTSASGADIAVVPVSGLTFATPAPPGSYYVRVRAQNACGTGPASPTQLLVTGCTPPGMPGTPVVSVAGSAASISWAAVGGATQYQVEVGTAAGASNVGVQTTASTSAQVTGLAPGTYFTRVRALNGCGPGATSAESTFTITPAPTATRVIAVSGNLAFGAVAVGQIASATLTIANSGNSTLTFTAMTCSCNVSVFAASPTSGTVPPGASRTITVLFGPLSAVTYGGTLTVVSDATAGNASISVSGTGVSVPPPPPLPGLHVWGGPGYTQYLGFFTCTFCVEYGTNSINNTFGPYGSEFSSTSIRNNFSQYGSPFSTYSACNQFASSPPRVFNGDGSIYYGELTLNRFRAEAISTSSIVSWLVNDVCP
jgi:hypothetical protein